MKTSCTVLLVEDNMVAQRITCAYLERENCQMWLAETAAQALSYVFDNHFDLILMDIGLPDGDGIAISEKIRNSDDCPNQQTPIVVVTAHLSSPEDKQCCFDIGINHVINKPICMDKVNFILENYQ